MPRKANLDPATEAKATQMVEKLRHHYDLGQRALRSEMSTKDFAEANGVNENTLRKIKAFANAYSPPEVNELLALRRPNGLPLHWGFLPILLVIDDPAQRKKMAERAARHGWTSPELHAEIPKKYRTKNAHGRSMKKPTTPEAGLKQLMAEAQMWIRRCDVVMMEVRNKPSTRRNASRARVVSDAESNLRELEKRAAKAADELAALSKMSK